MSYVKRSETRPGTTRRGRMLGYRYSQPGYYFVTICTHERQQLFGCIDDELLVLSPVGRMLHNLIPDCESRFESVTVDSYVVMPNHIHILVGLAIRLEDDTESDNLSQVMKWLKNTAARRYQVGVRNQGWSPYDGRVWQSGFHDHVVRNERDLDALRRYIATNVESSEKDKFHDH